MISQCKGTGLVLVRVTAIFFPSISAGSLTSLVVTSPTYRKVRILTVNLRMSLGRERDVREVCFFTLYTSNICIYQDVYTHIYINMREFLYS